MLVLVCCIGVVPANAFLFTGGVDVVVATYAIVATVVDVVGASDCDGVTAIGMVLMLVLFMPRHMSMLMMLALPLML
jgi:hypothetical protein